MSENIYNIYLLLFNNGRIWSIIKRLHIYYISYCYLLLNGSVRHVAYPSMCNILLSLLCSLCLCYKGTKVYDGYRRCTLASAFTHLLQENSIIIIPIITNSPHTVYHIDLVLRRRLPSSIPRWRDGYVKVFLFSAVMSSSL